MTCSLLLFLDKANFFLIMPKRLEDEFEEPSRPFYIIILHAVFVIFFAVYDALVFLPLKLFADPAEKRELSDRVKVRFFFR